MNDNTPPIHIEALANSIDKITIIKQKPKAGKTPNVHGQMYFVKYKDGPLRIIMPEMELPWQARISEPEFGSKVNVSVNFKGEEGDSENSRKLKKAHEIIRKIDDRMRKLIIEAGADMFPKDKNYKKTSTEIIAQRYKSLLQLSQDEDGNAYPERMSFNIQRSMDDPEKLRGISGKPLLIDRDSKPIAVNASNISDVLPRNSRIIPVVEAAYMFVKSTSPFGCSFTWNLVHAMRTSSTEAPQWNIGSETTTTADDADDEEEEYIEGEVTDDEEEDEDAQLAAK